MSVAQTSLLAYQDIVRSEELGRQALLVLKAIRSLGEASDNDLSRLLGLRINVVTARRNWLVNHGYITCSGVKPDIVTNKTNKTYKEAKKQ